MCRFAKALLAGVCLLVLPGPAGAGSLGDRISGLIGGNGPADGEFLPPDEAFELSAEVVAPDRIQVYWQIAEGYYLYRDKFSFEVDEPGVTVNGVALPEGEIEEDPYFGRVAINTGVVEAGVTLAREKQTAQGINLAVAYQGCKKDAICYPPQTRTLALALPAGGASIPSATGGDSATGSAEAVTNLSEHDRITQNLKDESVLLNIVVFFGFGLLLALTPCVFPMIPILSGIIVGHGRDITTGRAFLLSLVFVVAVSITYAVLGVIAGYFGFNLQAASQNIWVIALFSAVFIALALSMFGFYELQLPVSWQERLNQTSRQQKKGSLHGAAVMGVLSAIIVGPCVAPPLAGALLFISQTGDAVLGGLALFALGIGMGVPLLIIGTSAGKLLPRAGRWMEAVKNVFGVLLLGVAIWLLGRVLPGPVTMLLWALLIIVSAIYMGALDRVESKPGWFRLWKGLGLAMLVYGMTLIIGASTGSGNVLSPLAGITGGGKQDALHFTSISTVNDLERIVANAGRENKTVMLDYYADWCITCEEMERFTFSDPGVQAALQDVVLVKADVTANNDADVALLKRFGLFGPPAILFFRNGEEVTSHRLVGFVKAADFIRHVNQVEQL